MSAPLTVTVRSAAGRVTLVRAADLDALLAPLVAPALRAPVVERVQAAGTDQIRTHAAVVATLAGDQLPHDVEAWTPVEVLRDGAALVSLWPLDAPPAEVLAWLAAQAPDPAAAATTADQIRTWLGSSDRGADDPSPLDVALAGRAWLAVQAIERDRQLPFMALDAGRAHHALLGGMRDLPKSRRRQVAAPAREGWAEILHPDQQLRLHLNVRDLPLRIVHAIQAWRGWQGLRHWAALQVLFTDAGRTGRVRWTLEGHMEALGYKDRARRDQKVRDTVAAEVEALTRMDVAVYWPDGKLRLRGPVLGVRQRGEALHGSEWRLEGLELEIHEALYEGVRRADGTLGRLWAPAPAALAQIDHARHPHALALGLILPIRWRWDVGDRDHVALTGEKLIDAAGIKSTALNPGRAWAALARDLAELQRVGGLGAAVWEPGAANTPGGVCRLYPPQWVRDRLVHRIAPVELPPAPAILTGAELAVWRKGRAWSQPQAAAELGVGLATLKRAEAAGEVPLGRALRSALQRLR